MECVALLLLVVSEGNVDILAVWAAALIKVQVCQSNLSRAYLQTSKSTIFSFKILINATPFLFARRSVFVKNLHKIDFADRL